MVPCYIQYALTRNSGRDGKASAGKFWVFATERWAGGEGETH